MTIQRTTAGNLLRTTASGLMAKECCCGGVTPSSCTNQDPELLVSVSNLGATETINWCGQTWNLPADNGVQKTVCPTTYYKGKGYTLTNYIHASERWYFNADIQMARRYRVVAYGGQFYGNTAWANRIYLGPGTYPTNFLYRNFFGSPVTVRPVVPVLPGYLFPYSPNTQLYALIGTLAPATYNPGGYEITDDYFGSWTLGNVTYSWAKGNGW